MELVAYSTSHHFITRIFYRKLRGKSYFSRKANDNDALFVNYNLGVVMSRVEWSREAGVGAGGGGGGGWGVKKAQKQVNMGECFFMRLWFNR